MVGIVDYGVGNLFSLKSSLEAIGQEAVVSRDPQVIKSADQVILPGVGAFEDAIAKLRQSGMDKVVMEVAASGKPLMGICLGMQLLFDKSFEYGEHQGLGLIKGNISPLEGAINKGLKVPHMGWNKLEILKKDCPLFKDFKDDAYVYFVHSYYGTDCLEDTAAITEYSIPVTATVQRGNVFGCQFHPEKSGNTGLQILKAFCGLKEGVC